MPSTGLYLFLLKGEGSYYTLMKCQCPQRASTYFFEVDPAETEHPEECQCPQRASTYFFGTRYLFLLCIPICVNALNGLLLISSSTYRKLLCYSICVNALNGLLLISSVLFTSNKELIQMCQCPQRASTYFF